MFIFVLLLKNISKTHTNTYTSLNKYSNNLVSNEDDDAINNALINAMNQMESTAKQNKSLNDSNKLNDDVALKKHKSHILAKYSEVSDEELDYGNDDESSGNNLFQNTNAQDVEDRDRKSREIQSEVKIIEFYFHLNRIHFLRHIKNNKKKIKLMQIIKNKKMKIEKRKHNNEHKNKNVDDKKNIHFLCSNNNNKLLIKIKKNYSFWHLFSFFYEENSFVFIR